MAQISSVYATEPKGTDASGTSGQIERKTDDGDEQSSKWSTHSKDWWKPTDEAVGQLKIKDKI